jgi:CubicO group peptidase (beta-lactamase class C family)
MRSFKLFVFFFITFLVLFWLFDQQQSCNRKEPTVSTIPLLVEHPELNEMDMKLQRSSEKFFEEVLQKTRFNGAVLVGRNGKIIFEKYAGLTAVHSGNPIDSSTSFHLASVSKTFTAMAVLKLWEEGKLDINSSVSKYINQFPYPNITIRDLLNHRSGLPNYVHFVEKIGWDTKKYISNQEIAEMMINHASQLKAGRSNRYFDYCNTNYVLLALIIEKVSQLSYSEYLRQVFFEPLGMTHTFVFSIDKSNSVLQSYTFNNRQESMMFLDAVYGDKNIYSSVRDLLKWDYALYEGRLFKKNTLENAFKGYSYERKGTRNYGLGWRIIEMPAGKKIIYHNGWWHGNNTVFSRLPQDSSVIIVLGNKYNRSIYKAKQIAGIFSGYGIEWNEDE